jgi:hypothetical protein
VQGIIARTDQGKETRSHDLGQLLRRALGPLGEIFFFGAGLGPSAVFLQIG